MSDYYANLSKVDKRKYNKIYFSNYLSTNIFGSMLGKAAAHASNFQDVKINMYLVMLTVFVRIATSFLYFLSSSIFTNWKILTKCLSQ
jgi:hypothetical protein